MSQQRAVELDAVTDEPLAVVDEQPQVKLRTVQVHGREAVQAFLQRGASDVERVDRIRGASVDTEQAQVVQIARAARRAFHRDEVLEAAHAESYPFELSLDRAGVKSAIRRIRVDAGNPLHHVEVP
jgi:hypothetical protein